MHIEGQRGAAPDPLDRLATGQTVSREAGWFQGAIPVDDDGRSARRSRNRAAVLDAFLDLLEDGVDWPTADEIAARSGVSARSIFRFFADLNELQDAGIARQFERVAHLLLIPIDPAASLLHERAAALSRQRRNLWEAVTPSLFRPELDSVADLTRRRWVMDCLDVAASWLAWDYRRATLGRSATDAQFGLEHDVLAALAAVVQ
jgi:AcrR family transcriptional regulator